MADDVKRFVNAVFKHPKFEEAAKRAVNDINDSIPYLKSRGTPDLTIENLKKFGAGIDAIAKQKRSKVPMKVATEVARVVGKKLNLELPFDYGLGGTPKKPKGRVSYQKKDPFGYGGKLTTEVTTSSGELKGGLRYRVPTDDIAGAIIGKPFAKKAKGGIVKKYSNSSRKPRLK